MILKNKKYVAGIDFGAVSSGFSIAHVDKPHSKFTVNTWESESNKSEPEQFLTTILYKINGEMKCGISNTASDKALRDEGDVYIDNIKQYIFNIDQANKELGRKMKGLTIQKVVVDYLKEFHALAIECLRKQEDYNFKEDFSLENIGYCLSCPTSLNEFFADCFMEAGITEKDNLIFVSESEATAFHCLSLDRLTTKMVPDQTYFVYNIGHSSFSVSKIKADSTENFSEVELITEEVGKGSMMLENNFRDYLIKNESELKLNESIIDSLVETFVKYIKFSFYPSQEYTNAFDQENFGQKNFRDEKEDYFDEDDFDEDDFDEDDFDEDFDEEDFDQDEKEDYFDEDDFDQEDDKSDKDLVFTLRENSTNEVFKGEGDFEEDFDENDESEEMSSFFNLVDINGDPVKITTYDLEKHVFSPYIYYLIDYIMKVDSFSNIFFSGKYSADPNFYDKLSVQKDGNFSKLISLIEDTNIDAVSLGAVSFGLKVKNLQIPFFNAKPAMPKLQKDTGSSKMFESSFMFESSKKSKDKEDNKFDFIVGIDFGTTYTGCSYANPNDPNVKELKAIRTIETGWPGGNAIAFGKTPTLLMYDKKMRTKFWGQEAKQNADRYRDLQLLSNFKLFLSPEAVEAQYGVGNADIKEMKEDFHYGARNSVDAVQVIADYLKEVKEHVIRRIIEETKFSKGKKSLFSFSRRLENQPRIKFVLTVPAMWTASARETMAQVAIKATLITEDELDDLLIISEPEAVALFCVKKYSGLIRDPANPDAESNFVVCDAGGGTVDLVTFCLTRNPDNDEPTIRQIGSGIGDTCGSIYLDKAFKNYLLQFYNDIGIEVHSSDACFDSVMDDFTSNIKCNFKPDSTNDRFCVVKLPAERRIGSIPNTPQAKQYTLIEKNTKLKIKYADMKEKIFDPIIAKIIKLIQQQLSQTTKNKKNINAILLVGGFARNPYLQQRIQDEYRGVYEVKIPEEGVAAISVGAVSYGLNPRLISGKFAGQSVALEVRTLFKISEYDRLDKRVLDQNTGEMHSKNRLEYFIRKSDYIQGEYSKLLRRTVTVDYPNHAVIAVFTCDFNEDDDEESWKYVSRKHTKILEEIIKLPEIEEINEGDPIQFDVGLKLDAIGATVTIECQNMSVNRKIREMTNGNETSLKVVRKCNLSAVKSKKPLVEYSLPKGHTR